MSVKQELGQVFTCQQLANFMINLIVNDINDNTTILDPAIGPNTFFNYLENYQKESYFTGIEIDKDLISDSINTFYSHKKRKLITGDFFDLELSNKYDFIIENPPYVRQELIKNNNYKDKITNSLNLNMNVPSQSNLYVYFLIKSILHLNEGGKLIAVVYDSWLYSSFGEFLKKFMISSGTIKTLYHIKKTSFNDAIVGSTVIEFVKSKNISKDSEIKYYDFNNVNEMNILNSDFIAIKQKEFIDFNINSSLSINFNNNFFTPLENISSIKIHRGISSIANGYFLFDDKKFDEAIPIIKNVTKIKKYSVDNEYSYILDLNSKLSENTKLYLQKIEKKILETKGKYKALKEKISTNDNWYKINFKKSGNIIFNYYIRNNINFLLNATNTYCSDNFYTLQIDDNLYTNFAILNSSLIRLSTLIKSRNQGNGLRKLQLYEFKNINTIKLSQLSSDSVNELDFLGKQLSKLERFSFTKSNLILQIDTILINEYNIYTNSNLTVKDLRRELDKFQ